MRKFGIVHSRFFLWAQENGLSDKARTVALYMLICEHSNSLGCYRLPPAYAAADLGYPVDEVEKVYGELSTAGLLVYCEESEMVFFPQYLKWNPPNNGKHAKAILKIAESLPSAFGFGDMLVESLEKYCGAFIDKDALGTVSIRYGYGIDRVSDTVSIGYSENSDTVSKGYPKGIDTVSKGYRYKEKEKEKEKEREGKKTSCSEQKPLADAGGPRQPRFAYPFVNQNQPGRPGSVSDPANRHRPIRG